MDSREETQKRALGYAKEITSLRQQVAALTRSIKKIQSHLEQEKELQLLEKKSVSSRVVYALCETDDCLARVEVV